MKTQFSARGVAAEAGGLAGRIENGEKEHRTEHTHRPTEWRKANGNEIRTTRAEENENEQ